MSRRDKVILQKVISEINIGAEMIGDTSFESFVADEKLKRAVCMTVINIGELVKNITDETRVRYSFIPWKAIAGMRDLTAHKYQTLRMEDVYDTVKREFADRGCYFLNSEEIEKVRKTILINGALNAKIVGQKAHTIADLAGVKVPENTKILIGEVESVDLSEEFAHEKLSPVLAMYRAVSIDDAFSKAEQLIIDGGYGKYWDDLYYDLFNKISLETQFLETIETKVEV